jgi:hypothetical protein
MVQLLVTFKGLEQPLSLQSLEWSCSAIRDTWNPNSTYGTHGMSIITRVYHMDQKLSPSSKSTPPYFGMQCHRCRSQLSSSPFLRRPQIHLQTLEMLVVPTIAMLKRKQPDLRAPLGATESELPGRMPCTAGLRGRCEAIKCSVRALPRYGLRVHPDRPQTLFA